MSKKIINTHIEEVLIRLLTLEWYLDAMKVKDTGGIESLLYFFKKQVEESLKSLEQYYLEFNTKEPKVPKKTKKVIKNAKTHTKRKTKKNTDNKKSKVKNKKSVGRIQKRKVKIGE